MINSAILARVKARTKVVVVEETPVVEVRQKKPKEQYSIAMKDLETGEVTRIFENMDEAIDAGFSKPHVAGAVKNGNKYKSSYWEKI